jgi:hypothetical protein
MKRKDRKEVSLDALRKEACGDFVHLEKRCDSKKMKRKDRKEVSLDALRKE